MSSVGAAIDVVRWLAAERGLVAEPIAVADRSNLVLRLDPHPVVARVAMATSLARVGLDWLRREVEIARFLDAAGCRVTRPSRLVDPGPVERDGLVISFWELEEIVAERADPAEAGRELAATHRALAKAEGQVSLPIWGSLDEARQAFAHARARGAYDADSLDRLERCWERVDRVVASARERTGSFQPVHGDAHIGNVLATRRGAVWTDWEDAFVGPVEWDVACLRSKADLFGEERAAIDAMLEAYDHPFDASSRVSSAMSATSRSSPGSPYSPSASLSSGAHAGEDRTPRTMIATGRDRRYDRER